MFPSLCWSLERPFTENTRQGSEKSQPEEKIRAAPLRAARTALWAATEFAWNENLPRPVRQRRRYGGGAPIQPGKGLKSLPFPAIIDMENKNAVAPGCWRTPEPEQVNASPTQRPSAAPRTLLYGIFCLFTRRRISCVLCALCAFVRRLSPVPCRSRSCAAFLFPAETGPGGNLPPGASGENRKDGP